MLGKYKTRRMRTKLIEFFESKELNDWDTKFVKGCLRFQKEHPQLTGRQWELLQNIKNKHKE